jgi:nucleoside-diphosphate-sugar epimerase
MRILILGSSGVVGSALSTHLRSVGHDVTDWDIELSPKHDLSNPTNTFHLKRAIDASDFVWFLAYDVGGSKYLQDMTIDFMNRNCAIMANTFSLLAGKKFVFASSQMQNMMDNAYGVLKCLGEHYTQNTGGLSMRFWNVYGNEPVGEKSHVIPDFIHQAKTEGRIHMLTDGEEERQFLYTTDCSKCLEAIMNNYDEILATGRTSVDVTNHVWTKIKDVAEIIAPGQVVAKEGKKDATQTIRNEPDDFILKYWKPEITLEQGIKIMQIEKKA